MNIYSLALTFFVLANPIGNVPAVVGLIKDFPFEQQKRIMIREVFFAFLLAIFFQFVGERFLRLIDIQQYTLSIAGGILLLLVALGQIFPTHAVIQSEETKREPFIVPIATPIITGGGLMSSIMLQSSLVGDPLTVTLALVLAWIFAAPILMSAPYIQQLLGRQGILALEQLMGLILALLSIELIVKGAATFVGSV